MTIRKLILVSVMVLMLVLVAGLIVSVSAIDRIRIGGPLQSQQQQVSDYVADILPPPEYIIEPFLEATLVMRHPESVDAATTRLNALQIAYDQRGQYWRSSTLDPALRQALTETAHAPAARFWSELNTRFLPAAKAGRFADLQQSYARLIALYAEHRRAIDDAVARAAKFQTALTARSAQQLSNALWTLSAIGLIFVVGFLAFCVLVYRRVTLPLSEAAQAMRALSAGDLDAGMADMRRKDEIGDLARSMGEFRQTSLAKDAADKAKARADAEQKRVVDAVSTHLSELSGGNLTATIKVDFPREYAALKANFNDALGKLRGLIGSVADSAASIRTGSGEIAQAAEDLARRTESNAASLEETAASVTQMNGRLKASAEAATRTVQRADEAITTIGGGRAVADEAVQVMSRVSDSAKGIDSVIEGLDKIAFQTRVLAMNAAVEAGRAGDAGRGFAVVADLVSALAMRAEEEAKRARDQLTVTQTDIATAVGAVQRVDGALANISGDVSEVHTLLATMAADNQAQAVAIAEISAAIGMMDQSTQQNAAMVEQTSAAARNLSTEVRGLTAQASRFNTGGVIARPSVMPVAAPATDKWRTVSDYA